MNVLVQLGIGVVAIGLIMCAMFFMRKMRCLMRYVYVGLVMVAGVNILVCGLRGKTPVTEESVSHQAKKNQVEFAYAFVEQGEYEIAEELMDEYSEINGYDDECSLFTARVEFLKGSYAVAGGIYERLQTDDDYAKQTAEELALVRKKNAVDLSVLAAIRDLKENGRDPAMYGYLEDDILSMEEGMQITEEMIAETVFSGISEKYNTKDYEKMVTAVTEASRLYEPYLNNSYRVLNEEMTVQVTMARQTLKKMMDEEETNFDCVRNALLRMNLLLGDYEEIAENINANSTYAELMVASELYLEHLVQNGDFKDTYIRAKIQENKEYSDVVVERATAIYRDKRKSLDVDTEEDLEMLLDGWKTEMKYPALNGIHMLLEEFIKNGEAGEDTSKVYLQLAKIAHYYRDAKNRREYLVKAIETGDDCEDEEYSYAMMSIYNIINADGDINDILNASDYVEHALQNSLPDNMDEFFEITRGIRLYSNEEKKESLYENFTREFEKYVNTAQGAVNISDVDTDEFETVKVRLSVSSDYATTAEQLHRVLKITDCGYEIEEFTIEKINYTEDRTYLLCDVSGSMRDNITYLSFAVREYIRRRNPKEKIAISSFSDRIEKTMPFGSNVEELQAFADKIGPAWGLYMDTTIYPVLMDVLRNYKPIEHSNNTIILMTDGLDGAPGSNAQITGEMGAIAKAKNVKIFTIGMGSVNAEYLSNIAKAGNGAFVYAKDVTELDSLYSFLQGQIGNQYLVTFKVKDTQTEKNREFVASVSDGAARGKTTYSIELKSDVNAGEGGGNTGNTGGAAGENTGNIGGDTGNTGDETVTPAQNTGCEGTGTIEPETEGEEALQITTISLKGLSSSEIYKNRTGCDNFVYANLPVFTEDISASIKIYNEENQYPLNLTYKDAYTAEFTVPHHIEQGTYDIEVKVGEKKGYITKALVIREIKLPTIIRFGAYEFKADDISRPAAGQIRLSGNVVMNNWLEFKDAVWIEGDPVKDSSVKITDLYGSKVVFDGVKAKGYAKGLAGQGVALEFNKLGEFKIYNDKVNIDNLPKYKTDNILSKEFFFAKVLTISDVELRLFPDRFELGFDEVTTELPFQNVFGLKSKDPYKVDKEGLKISIMKHQIGFSYKYEMKRNKDVEFFNNPVDVKELNFEIDMYKDVYSCGFKASFLGFPTLGASMTVKDVATEFVKIEAIEVCLPIKYDAMFGPVPVVFDEFTFGVKGDDLVTQVEKRDFKSMTFSGSVTLGTKQLKEILPELGGLIRTEKRILSLPDTKLEFRLSPFGISGNAELLFMEEVRLANASLKIGQFEFKNALLYENPITTNGVEVSVGAGIKWKEDALSVDIGGQTTISAHTQFFGVHSNAHVVLNVDYWIIDEEYDLQADILLGFNKVKGKKKELPQFNIILGYSEGGVYNKIWFYFNNNEGKELIISHEER